MGTSTKKIRNAKRNNIKSMKRMLKPVVEKKRRDRMNQSLGELRALLLNYTSDSRLQNPKLEKAAILDLTVEYLQDKTSIKTMNKDTSSQAVCDSREVQQPEKSMAVILSLPEVADTRPPLTTIYTASFQQCISYLGVDSSRSPLEREGLIQGLKSYITSQQYPTTSAIASCLSTQNSTTEERRPASCVTPDLHLRGSTVTNTQYSASDLGGLLYPMMPDYLSPPLSPCLSCSSAFTNPPTTPSLFCHLCFHSGLPPSDISRCSRALSLHSGPSPPHPLLSTPLQPFTSLTPLLSPVSAPWLELFTNSPHWRPW